MPKEKDLREHLEGGNLDLSLSNLTSLPIKELGALPKAIYLDFSSNALASIPPDFCKLTHIVKLDLSQNQLSTLPANFGDLAKLQTLDLYNNALTSLPVSFCRLRSLKWLDVKNNPLMEPLGRIAGDCLDDPQCKKCALQVVSYMTQVHNKQEELRAKQLQEEQERAEARKRIEEQERQRKKEEKKAAKEKRRLEHERLSAENRRKEEEEEEKRRIEEEEQSLSSKSIGNEDALQERKNKSGLSCWGVFVSMIIGLIAVCLGFYFFCASNPKDESCVVAKHLIGDYYSESRRQVELLVSKWK